VIVIYKIVLYFLTQFKLVLDSCNVNSCHGCFHSLIVIIVVVVGLKGFSKMSFLSYVLVLWFFQWSKVKFISWVLMIFQMCWFTIALTTKIISNWARIFGGFSRDDQDKTTSMVEDWGQLTLILWFGIRKVLWSWAGCGIPWVLR